MNSPIHLKFEEDPSGAAYIKLNTNHIIKQKFLDFGAYQIILDLDTDNIIVGIEILAANKL